MSEWIAWRGGSNPAGCASVEIELRCGKTLVSQKDYRYGEENGFLWEHHGARYDIIKYRLRPDLD